MFDRNLARPITKGGLRFVQDLDPQRRSAPVSADPTSLPECR